MDVTPGWPLQRRLEALGGDWAVGVAPGWALQERFEALGGLSCGYYTRQGFSGKV